MGFLSAHVNLSQDIAMSYEMSLRHHGKIFPDITPMSLLYVIIHIYSFFFVIIIIFVFIRSFFVNMIEWVYLAPHGRAAPSHTLRLFLS